MKNILDTLREQSTGKKVLIGATALVATAMGTLALLRKKPAVEIEAAGDEVIIEVEVEETVVEES